MKFRLLGTLLLGLFLHSSALLGEGAVWVIDEREDYATRYTQIEKIVEAAKENSSGMKIRVIPKTAPPFEMVLGDKIGSGAMGFAFFVERLGSGTSPTKRQIVKFPRRVDAPGEENEIFSFKQDFRGLRLLQGKGGQMVDPKTSYEETPDLIVKTFAEGQEIAAALKTPENPADFGTYTSRLNELRLMVKGWDDAHLRVGDFGLMKNTVLTDEGWVVIDPGFVSENNREKRHLSRIETLGYPMQAENYVLSLIAHRGSEWLKLHEDVLQRVTYGSPPRALSQTEQTKRWREMLMGGKISGVTHEESQSLREWVLEIKRTRGTLHPEFKRKPFDPSDPWREEAERWLKDATREERANLFKKAPLSAAEVTEIFLSNSDGSFLANPEERARGLDLYFGLIQKGQGSRIPAHLENLKIPVGSRKTPNSSDLLIELLERHPELLDEKNRQGFSEAFSPWLKRPEVQSRLKAWASLKRLGSGVRGMLGFVNSVDAEQTRDRMKGFLECLVAEE